MRANQPMGLSSAARALTAGLVRVEGERFYEGYWDERFPLADYLAPDSALVEMLAARDRLAARLAGVDAAIEAASRALVAQGGAAYAEYLQAELSSSGPVLFLALRGPDGVPVPASRWSECGMETAAEGTCYCRGRNCVPGCGYECADGGQEMSPEAGNDD